MKTSNIKCRQFVNNCESFRGSNLSGVKITDSLYVVYSYGWWPIWAKINNQWYGHKEKYSPTTSKHTSQSWPDSQNIHYVENVEQLKANIAAAS